MESCSLSCSLSALFCSANSCLFRSFSCKFKFTTHKITVNWHIWWWWVLCPKAGSMAYATWGWDEWGGFPLPSSQTIMGKQLVQGRYAAAQVEFHPVTHRSQAPNIHCPPRPNHAIPRFTSLNVHFDWESNARGPYQQTDAACTLTGVANWTSNIPWLL